MFGKSSNDRFIMAAGRKAGNLKGNGTAPKTAPLKTIAKGQKPVTPNPSLKSRATNKNANINKRHTP